MFSTIECTTWHKNLQVYKSNGFVQLCIRVSSVPYICKHTGVYYLIMCTGRREQGKLLEFLIYK
jgi:hypothetical protein